MKMVVLVIMMMPLTFHFFQDFLASILEDEQLHTLLNLYDQISTNSYRPFRFQTLQLQALLMILNFFSRFPPSDACERLKEGLSALNYLEVSSLFIIIITITIIDIIITIIAITIIAITIIITTIIISSLQNLTRCLRTNNLPTWRKFARSYPVQAFELFFRYCRS